MAEDKRQCYKFIYTKFRKVNLYRTGNDKNNNKYKDCRRLLFVY